MNRSKLHEALVELQHQRATLDGAITKLQEIISMMNGNASQAGAMKLKSGHKNSYIDDGMVVLELAGKPLHIREIASRIGDLRHKKVSRASVESSIIRHIATFKDEARIEKVAPALFALPFWETVAVAPPTAE